MTSFNTVVYIHRLSFTVLQTEKRDWHCPSYSQPSKHASWPMDLSEELSGLTTALSDSYSLANSMLLLLLCWCFTALRHFPCHCSWASLLGSLSVLSTHSFASNLNDVIWAASSEFVMTECSKTQIRLTRHIL